MINKYNDRPFHVVMFVSRNKDNKSVIGFKERTRAFLTQKLPEELEKDFEAFCRQGLPHEFNRIYISVNSRKHEVVRRSLQHYLIDHPETNLANIESLIASLSVKKGTALTKKFLFDYDGDNNSFKYFLEDVKAIFGDENLISFNKTPNGYAVVTDRGFDTRELLAKWCEVELKRDGMLFVDGWNTEY